MRRFVHNAALLAAIAGLVGAAGCGEEAAGSGGAPHSLLPVTVDSPQLAVLNGDEITLDDLSERHRLELAKLRNEYYTEAHRLLEEGAIRAARERLLLAAAEEKGMTLNQYYTGEIGIPEVTDAEVQRVYDQNRRQFGGRSIEEVGARLRRQIANQKFTRKIELAGNRFLAEAEWDLTVPAYRVEVETEGHASLGPADAAVELVVFSDFECPYCRRFNGALDQLREEYEDEVRMVYRHYPIRSIHPRAQKAAEASICAEDQGKFWEFHDALWTDESLALDTLEQHARLLDLDFDEFERCLNSGRHYDRVQADLEAAMDLGQTGTPAVFVNGRKIGGAISFAELKDQVERELAESN